MNRLPIIILVLAAMAGGVWLAQTTRDTSPALTTAKIQGAIYPQAKVINDFVLQNQNNEKVTKSSFKNHWSLIFIGYTNCPDVCPATLAVMNEITGIMQGQKIQPPRVVFLSIDPERDTASVLKPYVEYFNKDFTGLTGTLDEVTRLGRQLNVVFRKSAGADGQITADNYLMDHSSALMLINPDGNLQSVLTAPHTPGVLIESIIKSQAYYESLL